jgi:DNA polymerase I
MAAYHGGDVYHALALVCGLTNDTDAKRWKANNQDMRQRMKSLQLAINYGMSVPSLARGLNRHPLIASAIIEKHRETFPTYWAWREEEVRQAMLAREIQTVFGWTLRLSSSPNKRTLYNFPMQGGGAEMLRAATQRLCEADIVPIMLVHDGILLEVDNEEQVAQAIEIMRWAGREVCNDFEIGVDVDQKLVGGARYRDKRPVAQKMWQTIMDALEAVGALPKRAAS